MSWFYSFCEKSFSRKDNMQKHVMSKHRNAGLTPFQTVTMFSQKCQRFRFENPFTSMIAGMTGSEKCPGSDLHCNKLERQFTLPRKGSFGVIHNGSPAYTQMLVAMPHIEFL